MTITLDGKYQTRDGRAVRILCVDIKGEFPVAGIVTDANGYETVQSWRSSGQFYKDHERDNVNDLIPVPEKRRLKGWVNVYEDYQLPRGCVHDDKEHADREASILRIACIPIDIEYEVGQGLDK